jgi:hypothetical protein
MLLYEVLASVADSPTSIETNSWNASPDETQKASDIGESIRFSLSNTHQEFIDRRDKLPSDLRAFLTPHSPDDYIKMETELYLSYTKLSGFGLKPDGELISLFSLNAAHEGDSAVEAAKEFGAKKLDCLGEFLREFYEGHGFEVKGWMSWDDKFRPDGWNEEKYGRPNVYYMVGKRDDRL